VEQLLVVLAAQWARKSNLPNNTEKVLQLALKLQAEGSDIHYFRMLPGELKSELSMTKAAWLKALLNPWGAGQGNSKREWEKVWGAFQQSGLQHLQPMRKTICAGLSDEWETLGDKLGLEEILRRVPGVLINEIRDGLLPSGRMRESCGPTLRYLGVDEAAADMLGCAIIRLPKLGETVVGYPIISAIYEVYHGRIHRLLRFREREFQAAALKAAVEQTNEAYRRKEVQCRAYIYPDWIEKAGVGELMRFMEIQVLRQWQHIDSMEMG